MPKIFTDGETLDADEVNEHLNHGLISVSEVTAFSTNIYTDGVPCKVHKVGRLVTVEFLLVCSAAGGSTGPILLTTPSTMDATASSVALGTALALDASAGSAGRRGVTVCRATSGAVFFVLDDATSPTTLVTAFPGGFPWTWAAGDSIGGRYSYFEAE